MSTTFRTIVIESPGSPLGLLPPHTIIDHYCNRCRARVETHELAQHARTHGDDKEATTNN